MPLPVAHSPPFPSWRKCGIVARPARYSSASGASAMTFDDILAQIIDLLQRQGRVSYGALKRRFDLDDDYLNDLKEELLSPILWSMKNRGSRLDGRNGKRTGSHLSPAQPPQQPAAQEQPSPRFHRPPTHHTPDAERRQLTVMFCDLVDSTNSPPSSTRKSGVTWCVPISGSVPTLFSATMGISPNCSGMVSSSILGIPRPMKMMPSEPYVLG